MATERIIGVDFGTDTSVIRVKRYQDEKPVGARHGAKAVTFQGSTVVPTLIREGDYQIWFGYDAQVPKGRSILHQNFRLDLESKNHEKKALAKVLTRGFFKDMGRAYQRQCAGGYLGEPGDVERTLISVPTKCSWETSEFLMEAARDAGFPNVTAVAEAQAAIQGALVQNEALLSEQRYLVELWPADILVLNMGAVTADIAVCQYTPGEPAMPRIMASWSGDADLRKLPGQISDILKEAWLDGEDIDLVVLAGGHSQGAALWQILTDQSRSFAPCGLKKICKETDRILQLSQPQETVALGLVYSRLEADYFTFPDTGMISIANDSGLPDVRNASKYLPYIHGNWVNGSYVISYDFPDEKDDSDDDELLRLQAVNQYLGKQEFSEVEFGEEDAFAHVKRTKYDKGENATSTQQFGKLIRGQLICKPAAPQEHHRFQMAITVVSAEVDHSRAYQDWTAQNPCYISRVFQTSLFSRANALVCRVLYHERAQSRYIEYIHGRYVDGNYVIAYDFPENEGDDDNDELLRWQAINDFLGKQAFSRVAFGENDVYAHVRHTEYDAQENVKSVQELVKLVRGELICTPAYPGDSHRFQMGFTVAPGNADHDRVYQNWCAQHPDQLCRVFQSSVFTRANALVCMVLFHEKET